MHTGTPPAAEGGVANYEERNNGFPRSSSPDGLPAILTVVPIPQITPAARDVECDAVIPRMPAANEVLAFQRRRLL